jgi:hypothetical protein
MGAAYHDGEKDNDNDDDHHGSSDGFELFRLEEQLSSGLPYDTSATATTAYSTVGRSSANGSFRWLGLSHLRHSLLLLEGSMSYL